MTMSYQRADATLNDALRGVATPHLWLHTGDPGAAGNANVAQIDPGGGDEDIERKALAFASAPANHAVNDERFVLNTGAVEWTGTEINAGENITHFSIWSADTDGTPEFVSSVAVPKTTGSDGVRIGIGDLEVAIEVHIKPA